MTRPDASPKAIVNHGRLTSTRRRYHCSQRNRAGIRFDARRFSENYSNRTTLLLLLLLLLPLPTWRKMCSYWRIAALHSCTVLSKDADGGRLPSTAKSYRPLVSLERATCLTVPSTDADETTRASGENATARLALRMAPEDAQRSGAACFHRHHPQPHGPVVGARRDQPGSFYWPSC
jgi:hypothetical protein